MLAQNQDMETGHALASVPDSSDNFVYIVDDDSKVRQALYFVLESAGFAPRSFRSGQDFLDSLDGLAPGCVLLDLRMPDLDGLEVIQSMGERVRKFPVVVITGHGEVPDAVTAMKRGASDFLEKPFAESDLIPVIEQVFRNLPQVAREEVLRAEAIARLARLTPREQEVVQGMVDGLSNKEIARRLGISPRTVEVHRSNLMDRVEFTSFAEVVRMALIAGLKPSMSLGPDDN